MNSLFFDENRSGMKMFGLILILALGFVWGTTELFAQTESIEKNALASLHSETTTEEAPPGGTLDSVLGPRIAKVSMELREIPKNAGQIWREFDITPYTKGRTFPAGSRPEQTIVDWIIRQTQNKTNWHSDPFSILTADSEKLYVYHTKEIMLEVADIVDRFVNPQFFNESYMVRVVALSRPDWITRGHQYLRPIPILSPGVQGWILEKQGKELLLQELGRRNDFKEIAPPQHLIPNGIAHQGGSKKDRNYLRDVQANASALNGYAEDRVTIEEGFAVTFVPLAVLDERNVDAIIKMDVIQVEKMITSMVDMPTTTNPRQRVQIESPQVATFKLDEQLRWPKDKVLLLDLGTVPLPKQNQDTESQNILSGLTKGFSSTGRANILLFIEYSPSVSGQANSIVPAVQGTPAQGTGTPTVPASSANSSYWRGVR